MKSPATGPGRRSKLTVAFALSQAAMLTLIVVLASTGTAAEPKGNSGTVKVDGVPFADLRHNEPHPSCDFRITFWGYGTGRGPARASFALQSPTRATTGPGSTSFGSIDIGTDPAGGGKDLDGQLVVNLASFLTESGATAHPKQGFHVKLTVNAPGSRGADVKHKVFWVRCAMPTTTTTPSSTSVTPEPSTSVLGTTTTGSDGSGGSSTVVSAADGAQRTAVLGADLARTGAPLPLLSAISAELLLLGMTLMRRGRRSSAGLRH